MCSSIIPPILPPVPQRQLHITRLYGLSFCMNGTQIGVLKQGHQVRLTCLLQSQQCIHFPSPGLHWSGMRGQYSSGQILKMSSVNQKPTRTLPFPDLAPRPVSGPEAVALMCHPRTMSLPSCWARVHEHNWLHFCDILSVQVYFMSPRWYICAGLFRKSLVLGMLSGTVIKQILLIPPWSAWSMLWPGSCPCSAPAGWLVRYPAIPPANGLV